MENNIENAIEFIFKKQKESRFVGTSEAELLVAYASQVKPEIKLPSEDDFYNAIKQYKLNDAASYYRLIWNVCINKIKRLNNITQ